MRVPVVQWENGDSRLYFYKKKLPNNNLEISAKLFKKNVHREFEDTGIQISERNMFVVKGDILQVLLFQDPQPIPSVSQLNRYQKEDILNSLSQRKITIERSASSENLTIHI